MSAVPFVATRPALSPRLKRVASHPLAVALTLTALITAVRCAGSVDSDVAWQLWVAGRINSGAHLYRDIIEVNPPLWFWMALPIDRLAALFHVRVEVVLVMAIGSLVALSLAATDRLAGSIAPPRRALLLGYAAVSLMAMPWAHAGQREQIVLIGTLPYATLIAARRQDAAVPPVLAALIGIGAALGFALKHYFLMAPALLELWLFLAERRHWRALRPETAALALTGVAYLSATLMFAPEYLSRMVPLIRVAYGVFGAPRVTDLVKPFAIMGMATLAVLAAHRRRLIDGRAPLACALSIAAAAFALAYLIEFKGWTYHAIPMLGCASVALVSLFVASGTAPRLTSLMAPALLLLPLWLAADEKLHDPLPSADLVDSVAGLRPGEPVGFLATEPAIPWSVTLQGRYRYASRYMGYWMMQAIVWNESRGSPDRKLAALGKQIVTDTVEDFTCIPPKRIIVSRPRRGEGAFDILPFFLRDPQFRALLSHYVIRSRTTVETYVLASPLPKPASSCRTGV